MKERLIALMDGTGMGDTTIIFRTNAPKSELKRLEEISCQIYSNGGDSEDIPIWHDVLKEKGYLFDAVDEHQHVTPYGSSSEWLEREFPNVLENYVIDNHPVEI